MAILKKVLKNGEKMSHAQRAVTSFLMRERGLSISKIAEKMGMNYGSVASDITSVRRAIKINEVIIELAKDL